MKGQSAPYLRNAVCRIDSLCAKMDNNFLRFLNIPPKNIREFASALAMTKVKDAVFTEKTTPLMLSCYKAWESFLGRELSDVVNSLLLVAKRFHAFYETNPIVGSPSQNDLKAICEMVGLTLVYGMTLLGIESYPSISNRHINSLPTKKHLKST